MHTSSLIPYFSFPWTFLSHRFYVLINYQKLRFGVTRGRQTIGALELSFSCLRLTLVVYDVLRINLCMHVSMHVYLYVCMLCIFICIYYVCMHVNMYVSMHACIYAWIYCHQVHVGETACGFIWTMHITCICIHAHACALHSGKRHDAQQLDMMHNS